MENVFKVEYDGWKAELKGKELEVTKDGKTRIYDIKQKNEGIIYDKSMPEYFEIKTKNFTYNFKFEVDDFFVGDKVLPNGEVTEYACWDVVND